MTVPNLGNWRRFTQTEGDGGSGLLDIYADERVGGKGVLTIMMRSSTQYASGPRFNPTTPSLTQHLRQQKIALPLDSNALRLIEGGGKQSEGCHPIADAPFGCKWANKWVSGTPPRTRSSPAGDYP